MDYPRCRKPSPCLGWVSLSHPSIGVSLFLETGVRGGRETRGRSRGVIIWDDLRSQNLGRLYQVRQSEGPVSCPTSLCRPCLPATDRGTTS